MTAPHWLIRHKRLKSYIAEHDIWPSYIVRDVRMATRYPTPEAANARRIAIGEDFAPFFEVVEDEAEQ